MSQVTCFGRRITSQQPDPYPKKLPPFFPDLQVLYNKSTPLWFSYETQVWGSGTKGFYYYGLGVSIALYDSYQKGRSPLCTEAKSFLSLEIVSVELVTSVLSLMDREVTLSLCWVPRPLV